MHTRPLLLQTLYPIAYRCSIYNVNSKAIHPSVSVSCSVFVHVSAIPIASVRNFDVFNLFFAHPCNLIVKLSSFLFYAHYLFGYAMILVVKIHKRRETLNNYFMAIVKQPASDKPFMNIFLVCTWRTTKWSEIVEFEILRSGNVITKLFLWYSRSLC